MVRVGRISDVGHERGDAKYATGKRIATSTHEPICIYYNNL